MYYVGCKNDILPNTDDHLDEVAVLQRGVEVSFSSLLILFYFHNTIPNFTFAQVPTYREDKNHYNLIVPNKLCIKKDKAKEVKTENLYCYFFDIINFTDGKHLEN